MKRKISALSITLILIMLLSSCAKKNGPGETVPSGVLTEKVAIEDYWQRPILESENGYYYNASNADTALCMHYIDKSTGKDVILCTKPECRHDGNEFCVATNKKYIPFGFNLYDGAIYMGAICLGENQYDVKLVKIALDGSSLTEVATIFTSNLATNSDPTVLSPADKMILHRGKAFFQICITGNDRMEDTVSYGAAIYDLNEGTLHFFNEESLSRNNPELENVSVRGDYLYYIVREGKKRVLHKYGLLDESDEPLELLTNFTGDYAVMNNGNVFYFRTRQNKLYVRRADGTNQDLGGFEYAAKLPLVEESIPDFIKREWITMDAMEYEYDSLAESGIAPSAMSLQTDGETLFVFVQSPQDWTKQYYFTLPEEETDLMYYYLDPQNAIDPETGRWLLSVQDIESRLVSITLYYRLSNDHKVVMIYDGDGKRQSVLYPSIYPPAADTDTLLYTFRPFVTKDKIYCEIAETDIDTFATTRLLYVAESLSDLLEEKPFPAPFFIRNLR